MLHMADTLENNLNNAVAPYLAAIAYKKKWERDQGVGAGYYYALTYARILSFFEEHPSLSEALELKIALVFSWNPTICKITPEKFAQAREELAALETLAAKLRNTDILKLDTDITIHKLWHPLKKATSSRGSPSGVSVTKFLHFSFPHLFPMIDLNTMRQLGGSTVNLTWYSVFLSDWQNLYRRRKTAFDRISQAADMPLARVLDVMLFTPK